MKNSRNYLLHPRTTYRLLHLPRYICMIFVFGFLIGSCTNEVCDEPDWETVRGVDFNLNGKLIVNDPQGNNIAPLFQGERFRAKFWKQYCHGKVSDIYAYDYLTDLGGSLIKQSFETRNFNMQNPLDLIEFAIYYVSRDGEEIHLVDGKCRSYDWKPGLFSYSALGNMTILYESDGLFAVNWSLGYVTVTF